MPEMRKVILTDAACAIAGTTSTYWYENKRYFLKDRNYVVCNLEVANSWVSADANVTIMPSDKE